MKAFFLDKFEYTHHCNQLVIDVIYKYPETYIENISLLASHTLTAHHIWNQRVYGVAPLLSVWQLLKITNLYDINNENFEQTKEIIQNKNGKEYINYTNSKDQNFTNTAEEILFHIINHSTYHRGQLINLLKNKGLEPIVTDYIFYKR